MKNLTNNELKYVSGATEELDILGKHGARAMVHIFDGLVDIYTYTNKSGVSRPNLAMICSTVVVCVCAGWIYKRYIRA